MSEFVEFRHLKYIVAVADTANFTRAAERLFLAQPSLSKQIKDLEEELGFPIFNRSRDGARLTPAGEMIVSYAREVLLARSQIIARTRAVHRREVPPLRLGFSSFVTPRTLELFRESYAQLFPSCDVQLSSGDPVHILGRLEQGALHAAFLPMPIEGTTWVLQQVAKEPLVVCMRLDDPLSRMASVEICELASRLRIFRDPEMHHATHKQLIELFSELGISIDVACSAATPSDMQWMVREKYGLALIEQGAALDPELTTRQIAGVNWTTDIAFVHHRDVDHVALPFVPQLLQDRWDRTSRKRVNGSTEQGPTQLSLLT